MNKKLLTLAVAAALAAPTMASAEAILYGKMNVSLDYESIDNVVRPYYNDTATQSYQVDGFTVPSFRGFDTYVNYDAAGQPAVSDTTFDAAGNVTSVSFWPNGVAVPSGSGITTQDQLDAYQAFKNGTAGRVLVAPGQLLPGQKFSGWGMNKGAANGLRGEGRANRFGLKGSEDLGNGLKAVYQIEVGVNFDTNNNLAGTTYNGDTFYYRNTFLGLAGDFGTVLMGRHDTPLKISTAKLDLFSDTMADYNGTIGFDDVRADNTVAYISPSWSGFQLAAAVVPAGMANVGFGATANNSFSQNVNADQINSGYSLAGIYKNGPFYGSVAYESFNEELYQSSQTSLNGCVPQNAYGVDNNGNAVVIATRTQCQQPTDYNKWRVGLGILDWNGFTLTGIYEQQTDIPSSQSVNAAVFYDTAFDPLASRDSWVLPGSPDKRELWQIQAGYAYGNFMFKGMYGQTTYSGDYLLPTSPWITAQNRAVYSAMAEDFYNGGTSSWAIGVDYNFSKRTQAYILYTATTADGSDNPLLANGINLNGDQVSNRSQWDGFSLGMMHSF